MGITIYILLLTALTATVTSAPVVAAGLNILIPRALQRAQNVSESGVYAGASSFGFNPSVNNPIKLPWFGDLPFPNFPQFPTFDQIKPITGQNVILQGTRPGSNFNNVMVSSHHTSSRGENGQVDSQSGSTVVLNDNGQVTVHKTGNAPPEVTVTQYKIPPFSDSEQPKFKRFKRSNLKDSDFDFDFPSFKPITFQTIDTDSLKGIVPESNEQFQGRSWSSNSYSSDDNGVKSSGGEAAIIINDNGKVKEAKFSF